MKHIIVMGAGVIGTTTAWYLKQQGFDVTVIDRCEAAGLETSFANGGQISVSHAQPWASPQAPVTLLKSWFNSQSPLLFPARLDSKQWQWGLQFIAQCTPNNVRHNINQLVNLGLYSRTALQQLRQKTDIQYHCLTQGILHYYTNKKEFDTAKKTTQLMNESGCSRQVIDVNQAIDIEPALTAIAPQLVGATYTPEDESGNAFEFTQNLAKLCQQQGVNFIFNTNIEAIEHAGKHITGVDVRYDTGKIDTLTADAFVLALGSYSPMLAEPLGINLSIYPAKGYSVTFEVTDASKVPEVSLTDDEYKLVMSRYGSQFRVAGMAEFNGFSLQINPKRCQTIVDRISHIFPNGLNEHTAKFWTGLRPATPSNVPYIGKTSYKNLFLNAGHGTLGWTHACGSAKAVAAIIQGKTPNVDFTFAQ